MAHLGRARDLPPFEHSEFLNRVHPEDRARCAAFLEWENARKGGQRFLVFRFDVEGRGERLIASSYEPMKDERGATIGIQGLNKDVTDGPFGWHETTAMRVVLDAMPIGAALFGGDRIVYVNDVLTRILQRDRSDIVGMHPSRFWDPEKSADYRRQHEEIVRGGLPAEPVRRTVMRPDGSRREVELSFATLPGASAAQGFVANIVDLTDRAAMEKRLTLSEARLRAAFDASGIGIWIGAPDYRILDANTKLGEILEMPIAELVGMDWRRFTAAADQVTLDGLVQRIERHELDRYARVGQLTCRSGRIITAEIYSAVVRDADGRPSFYVTQVADVTARMETERQLREMVLRFRQVTETIDDVFWVSDLQQRGVYVSPAVEKIWGRRPEDFYADRATFFDSIHPEDRAAVEATVARQSKALPFSHEFRIVRPDGGLRWILDKGFPVVDADGIPRTYVGVARDITVEKKLRESVDRAQRLEAIGQLTGELAHDFNNLLSIVTMNAIQAQKRVGGDEKLRRQLDTILATAMRGGRVTKSLLAVARRQHLKSETCSLDPLLESSRGLIETSAGPTTELHIHGSGGRAFVDIDPAAFSNALLNLVINARDAMPGGGSVTIAVTVETLPAEDPALAAAELPAGSYAVVEVADTGTGMSPEILARIWEPFFSTKEAGHGSGLGLPAVYGFAVQSRGTAVASSEPGVGTRVRILLPQVDAPPPRESAPGRYLRKGWGRILLVDDEPDLAAIMSEALEQIGYDVSTAASGDEALRILESKHFDAMLSDVAMRRMSGVELARRAQDKWPAMKILLMSGFAAGAMPAGLPWPILEKPLSIDALAAALGNALLPSA